MPTTDVKVVVSADDRASATLQNFGATAQKVGNAVAAGMAVAGVGLTAFAKSATDYTVDLVKSSKDLARETGTSVENASQLIYVTQRMGISAEQASQLFGVFSKQIVAATDDVGKSSQAHAELQNKIDTTKLKIKQTTDEINKNGDKTGELNLRLRTLNTTLAGQQQELTESTNAFTKLGIKVVDAQGNARSFNDILLDTADRFKSMQNGSEKTALAMQLFGKAGKDMLPLLNQGSQGIRDLEQRADQLGLTLNAQTIGSVSRYIESQKRLTDSSNALKLAIGEVTAPVLTAFNEKVNNVIMSLIATDSPMRGFTANVLAFGGPALSFGASAIAVAANIATITTAAGGATKALAGLQAVAAIPIIIETGAAVAALAVLAASVWSVYQLVSKTIKAFDDLSHRKVSVGAGANGPKVSGTSDTGMVQQLMRAFQGFASGTDSAPGGMAIVGEEGPELVNLPRGSQVIPADKTRQAMNGSGSSRSTGGSTQINITVKAGAFMGNPQDARQYAKLILSALQDVASSSGKTFDDLWRHNGVRSI